MKGLLCNFFFWLNTHWKLAATPAVCCLHIEIDYCHLLIIIYTQDRHGSHFGLKRQRLCISSSSQLPIATLFFLSLSISPSNKLYMCMMVIYTGIYLYLCIPIFCWLFFSSMAMLLAGRPDEPSEQRPHAERWMDALPEMMRDMAYRKLDIIIHIHTYNIYRRVASKATKQDRAWEEARKSNTKPNITH